MATWEQIKEFIRSNYKLQKDDGDLFQMVFNYNDGRSQLVFIHKTSNQNETWMQISSPVGLISSGNLNAALETLDNALCGGMVKIGEKHFVRHCMPIDDLVANQIVRILSAVVGVADTLEEKFVGGDAN